MAVLSLQPAVTTLQSLAYISTTDQRAFTDAMADDAAVVTRAIGDLDLRAISQHMATAVVSLLR